MDSRSECINKIQSLRERSVDIGRRDSVDSSPISTRSTSSIAARIFIILAVSHFDFLYFDFIIHYILTFVYCM